MKLTVVLNPENKYRNALFLGNRMIVNGNSGLKNVRLIHDDSKHAELHLTLTDFNIVIQNDKCPEAYRFKDVQKILGIRSEMIAFNPACEMLQISATACDGCPKNPTKPSANQPTHTLAGE